MSVVTYGDPPVTLAYPHHTDFRQEAVYDPEGGVERIYTRYEISVESVVNFNYLSFMAPDLVGRTQSPADVMNVIRSRLLQPRKTLSIKINGVDLIPPPQVGLTGTVDAKNGPQPQACVLQQLTNTTFLMVWRCIAHYTESLGKNSDGSITLPVNNQPGNPVLSNRWSETVDIDLAGYSKRTREGSYIIRSDNFFGVTADTLRNAMAVTGVPKGFLRESSSYTVDPSGLGIRYRIVDAEKFKLPPPPAFEATGSYTESSVLAQGAQRFGEIRLRLKGSKDTDQAELLQQAVRICSAKVRNPGATLNKQAYILSLVEFFAVNVEMYENVVEVHMRVRLKPADDTKLGTGRTQGEWGLDYKALTYTPGSDDISNYTPAYQDRGTASILLQAAAMWDPALVGNSLSRARDNFITGLPVGAAGRQKET